MYVQASDEYRFVYIFVTKCHKGLVNFKSSAYIIVKLDLKETLHFKWKYHVKTNAVNNNN